MILLGFLQGNLAARNGVGSGNLAFDGEIFEAMGSISIVMGYERLCSGAVTVVGKYRILLCGSEARGPVYGRK